MKKDKERLKEEIDRYLSYEGVNEARNALMFAKGVIDQLEEPEITEEQAWDLIYEKYGSENLVKVYKELLEREGYVIKKKEKLYTVCFQDKKSLYKTGIYLYKQDGKVNSVNAMDNYYPKDSESHLTEKEIKDYDERFWQFAEPVEEVTE